MKRRLIAALFPVLCLGMVGVPGCADLTATIGASTQQPEPSPVPLLGTQDTVTSKFSHRRDDGLQNVLFGGKQLHRLAG